MTKLKNTKKGMAKKALSISLVAAMLATSNVPVWAADVFSDGSAGEVNEAVFDTGINGSEAEEAPFADDTVMLAAAPTTINSTKWMIGEKEYNTLPCDAGTVTFKVTLDNSIETGKQLKFEFKDNSNNLLSTIYAGEAGAKDVSAALSLDPTYAGKQINVSVSYGDSTNGYTTLTGTVSKLTVTEADSVVPGSVSIKSNIEGNIICPGAVLTVDTSKVENEEGTTLKYVWQKKSKGSDDWVDLGSTNTTYTVKPLDYEAEIRVGVYTGSTFYDSKTLFTTEKYTVVEKMLFNDNQKGGIVTSATKIQIGGQNTTKKEIDLGDYAKNELSSNDIVVIYKDLSNTNQTLTFKEDYTLSYEPQVLNSVGTVTVKIHIQPTSKTDYTEDTIEKTYELVTGTTTITDASDYKVTFQKEYTYNGEKQTPVVTNVTYKGKSLNDTTDYKVQQIGKDAGKYNLVLYITDKDYLYVKADGTGSATALSGNNVALTIQPKNVTSKEVADNIKIEIPDEVWSAAATDVNSNKVTVKGEAKKIKIYDNAIDVTEDIADEFTIEAMNWNTTDAKKAIRFTGKAGNYKGYITVNGEENVRSITQFKDAFVTFFANKGNGLVYNGKLQDVLATELEKGNGTINLQGTNLTLGTNFTYEIISGGINAGNVSIRIKGAGIYEGEMELPNAYKIGVATFKDVTGKDHVDDNTTSNNLNVSYNPRLGDEGAKIESYESLAKTSYKAWMKSTKYALTEGLDYWLDRVSVNAPAGSDFGSITYRPTVDKNLAVSRKEGNKNFDLENNTTRSDIKVHLVEKDLHDSDIQVRVLSADYNSGNAVTPQVEVVYVENGTEYKISSDYYYVELKKAASALGSTGEVNVIAKTTTATDANKKIDRAKYPQLYTGNKSVEYVVGDASLEGGKIVATNDQETLPSVAYDATAAASEKGITLAAKNYVVKDRRGNVVDPKYYDISYSNNKAAGTATITATGKGQYKGSVSAQFTITANKLPSGTVTLMGDNIGKVYTGEAVSLTLGTDYTVSGELAKLTLGTDYMVTYENNINVTEGTNKAKIKFVGINNYAGELVKEFDITSAQIKAENIVLGDATYAGGATIKPQVTITIPGGNTTLKEGTDYTVEYMPAATNVGDTGKVVITYNKDNKNINAKDSAKEVTYGVTAKDLKDVTVDTIPDQEVTGSQIKPVLTVMNGSVRMVEGTDYTVTYGTNTDEGEGTATIKPVSGNANYTGEQTVKFNIVKTAPQVGQAMIRDVVVSGNKATAILSGPTTGAEGYDFVIATEEDYKNGRVAISKNILTTRTNFYYVQEGTYYAYCHAWTRGEDGKKVFGDWSNLFKFEVTATTPSKPSIKSVKVSGRTVTVTLNGSANADGYDVVLGTSLKKVNGEQRPVNYGTLVKKNQKTTTIKFTNVPKGSYYVGTHAYNRTSENGTKVFSKWSGSKKVTVK